MEARLVPVEDLVSLVSSSSLSEEQQVTLVAIRMRALADPTRVRILKTLISAPKETISVNRLAKLLGIAQSCISRHLQHLVFAGFLGCVESKGKGVDIRRFYYAKIEAIKAAFSDLLNCIGIVQTG